MDWFLYDNGLRLERVKLKLETNIIWNTEKHSFSLCEITNGDSQAIREKMYATLFLL